MIERLLQGSVFAESILVQEVLLYVDKSTRPSVVGEFSDKSLSLLNEALDGS